MTAIDVSISITLQKSPAGQPYGGRHFAYCLEVSGTFHYDLTKQQEFRSTFSTEIFMGLCYSSKGNERNLQHNGSCNSYVLKAEH